jgi:hypothetical protein
LNLKSIATACQFGLIHNKLARSDKKFLILSDFNKKYPVK